MIRAGSWGWGILQVCVHVVAATIGHQVKDLAELERVLATIDLGLKKRHRAANGS